MSDFARMEQEIEELRKSLNKMVAERRGNLHDADVMKLSSRLDHLIVEFERARILRTTAGGKG